MSYRHSRNRYMVDKTNPLINPTMQLEGAYVDPMPHMSVFSSTTHANLISRYSLAYIACIVSNLIIRVNSWIGVYKSKLCF